MATKKSSGLGRGLASLIPGKGQGKAVSKAREENVYNVDIHLIRANPNQPRREFEAGPLKELADSIKKYGILQPIVVSKVSLETDRGLNIEYEIVAGERRWRAAQLAGLPHIPVVVRQDFDERQMKLEVALVENVQREDLNPLEEAQAYVQLAAEFKLTQAQIAEKVGKSRESVANTMRLMGLPANIKEALRNGKLVRSQARALLAFKDDVQQQNMFKTLMTQGISSDVLEDTARMIHGGRKSAGGSMNPRYIELQENLSKNLGTFVSIRTGSGAPGGGHIQIKFANLEELNTIAKTILD